MNYQPKETPILFSTNMVLALLAGNKTMTRRISQWEPFEYMADGDFCKCPYGKIGDNLWVREAWQPCGWIDDGDGGEFMVEFMADGKVEFFYPNSCLEKLDLMVYNECKRNGWEIDGDGQILGMDKPFGNRPGIHLFKELSRVWLEVTNIKVERVQDISEDDILKEGVRIPTTNEGHPLFRLGEENSALSFLPAGYLLKSAPEVTKEQLLKAHWAELWCKINGRESWDANPWVWAIEFKVLSTDGHPVNHG